jgi:DNA polymerase beta
MQRNLPSRVAMTGVIKILEEMGEINQLLGERFKVKSYQTAVASLRNLESQRISQANNPSFLEAVDLKDLPGVGSKIQKKIEEILSTGKLKEHEELKNKPVIVAVEKLTQIHGIGPQKAKQLFESHHISTVDELRAAQDKLLLTDAQVAGLAFFDDIRLRIPHSEIASHEKLLQDSVRTCLGSKYITKVCGSFRRNLKDSGDVDALLAVDPLVSSSTQMRHCKDEAAIANLVSYLTKDKYWLRTLAMGGTKCMGICKLREGLPARRVDVRLVPPESFPTALLYFTGSKAFNVRMRQLAADQGFTLNEYGLFRIPPGPSKKGGGKASSAQPSEAFRVQGILTERDVFGALGMPYVEPEKRVE